VPCSRLHDREEEGRDEERGGGAAEPDPPRDRTRANTNAQRTPLACAGHVEPHLEVQPRPQEAVAPHARLARLDVHVAIETSTRQGSVAVRRGTEVRRADLGESRAHASDLMPAIDRLVKELGGTPDELASVLVGTGPGSYTGLRVGIATALGLARASGARARGVSSGEVLSFGVLEPGRSAYHLIDGRSGGFYFAHFLRTDDEIEVLEPPIVLGREELPGRLAGSVTILTDDATAASSGLSPEMLERVRTDVRPDASALLALGLARLERLGPHALDAIEPLYLRPFGQRHGE